MAVREADLMLALEAMAPPATAGARERVIAAMTDAVGAPSRPRRSKLRWALAALAALLFAVSPPGQAVAEKLGELVGIGDESTVTEPNLRDPRLTGKQDRVGPAIVTATGTVPGTNVSFEIVGWAALAKTSALSGAEPGAMQTCLGTVWPDVGEQSTGKWCQGDDGSERVPYPFHTFGGGGTSRADYGPNAPYEFVGVTRPEVARVELTYRDADGDLVQGPVTLGILDGELLEKTGGNRPFGFFEAFVPYDGLPRDKYGFTGSPAAESAVITVYDAEGEELGSQEVGARLRQARLQLTRRQARFEAEMAQIRRMERREDAK